MTLGPKTFATKKDATAEIRRILWKYEPLQRLDDEDFEVVRALLNRHPWAETKIGAGVVAIRVNHWGTGRYMRCFETIRRDNTVMDFSYLKCLAAHPDAVHRDDVRRAFRRMIQVQIDAFRDALPEMSECAITGVPLHRSEGDIVHKDPPFERLVHDWVELMGLTYAQINNELFDHSDTPGVDETHFKDSRYLVSWCGYHQEHAILQHITHFQNMSKGNRAAPNRGPFALPKHTINGIHSDGSVCGSLRSGAPAKCLGSRANSTACCCGSPLSLSSCRSCTNPSRLYPRFRIALVITTTSA